MLTDSATKDVSIEGACPLDVQTEWFLVTFFRLFPCVEYASPREFHAGYYIRQNHI